MDDKVEMGVQDCRQLVSGLLLRVEELLAGLDHKTAVDAEILRLGYQINAEYAPYEGMPPRTVSITAEEQLQERIGPIKVEINKLRAKSQAFLDSIHSLEREARKVVARCARVAPSLTPVLNRFWGVYGSRFAPDLELLKLRDLLAEAQARLDAVPLAPALPPSEGATAGKEIAAGISRKRVRGPHLAVHRERVELWDKLAEELAHIWRATRKYATVQGLKEKYPDFEIWKLLPDPEQRELLDGNFKPKAYAGSLVLQKHALTSLETLRKSRKLVRNADRQRL
jgi:hypothetical protein